MSAFISKFSCTATFPCCEIAPWAPFTMGAIAEEGGEGREEEGGRREEGGGGKREGRGGERREK